MRLVPVVVTLGSIVFLLFVVVPATYWLLKHRFLRRLREYANFSGTPHSSQWDLIFCTVPPENPGFAKLRTTHALSCVEGVGSDQERAIRVMHWVHDLARHAPNPSTPKDMSAMNLIRLCQEEGQRINCLMYSRILSECLLSLGIPARMIHLLPLQENPKESHFVVSAFLRDQRRWIMLDPDMRGHLANSSNELLGIAEIRDRLVRGDPLVVNDDINMAGIGWMPLQLKRALYRTYIAKNIFRVACYQQSPAAGAISPSDRLVFELIPDGFHPEWLKLPRTSTNGSIRVFVNDAEGFWRAPSS
ncbi:transglutaminase-like domain-containing protein [Candidatus Bipolaricaulota bacterium]